VDCITSFPILIYAPSYPSYTVLRTLSEGGVFLACCTSKYTSFSCWRKRVGMGLQHASTPWGSRGRISEIWNSMWFGRTNLAGKGGETRTSPKSCMSKIVTCTYTLPNTFILVTSNPVPHIQQQNITEVVTMATSETPRLSPSYLLGVECLLVFVVESEVVPF